MEKKSKSDNKGDGDDVITETPIKKKFYSKKKKVVSRKKIIFKTPEKQQIYSDSDSERVITPLKDCQENRFETHCLRRLVPSVNISHPVIVVRIFLLMLKTLVCALMCFTHK